MLKRVRHWVAFACFTAALFSSAAVYAASLEKIEVGSQLGEPFYAEVPLKLEADESVTRLFVEIAAPADYKIFEVYRDPVLSTIRADITSDKRGARVKLSSRSSIHAPFFNLVLKVRYGRVAHFKKYAVFLEPAKSIQTAAQKTPQPTIEVGETGAQGSGVETAPLSDAESEASAATEQRISVEGWARTDRYGPIVYGDMLSTVAERLRADKRYKPTQVMAALFEKNKSKFDSDNMNMLKAGSFLDVPTAAEVEQRSAKDAYELFAKHEKQWKELTRKPRYAVIAEAQRTRYSKRVSIGGQAKGSAAAPVMTPAIANAQDSSADSTMTASQGDIDVGSAAVSATESEPLTVTAADKQQAAVDIAQANPLLAELQVKNEALQQQLLANQQSIEAMNAKLDGVATAAAAASTARIEKLEVLLVRLQAELERSNKQASVQQQGPDWIIWLLVALVVILLGAVGVLMRREPAHPADTAEVKHELEETVVGDSVPVDNEALVAPTIEETEEDVFDSISSFADDLTDTDTAEMEPFDVSLLDEDPDPNIDYLSEADVYVRYGMDDEALHQLNLALRLQPQNPVAHIKKAQLLRRTGELTAFHEAKVEAGSVLESADLEQFNAALHEASSDTQVESLELPSEVGQQHEEGDATVLLLDSTENEVSDKLADSSEDDGIDFDLSDIEVLDHQHVVSQEPAMEEMDWLHDDSFEPVSESTDASTALIPESVTESGESMDADENGVTQMFDNLMDEFSDDDQNMSLADSAVNTLESGQPEVSTEDMLDLTSAGASRELDGLLSEFTDQDEASLDTALSDPSPVSSDRTLVIDDALADIDDLDHLLGDFADDDDVFNFAAESNELDASVFKQAETAVSQQEEDEIAFGATEHLDILMSEFTEKEDADFENIGLDNDLFEQPGHAYSDAIAIEENQDATHELNHLLSEFAEDEAEVGSSEGKPFDVGYDGSTTIEMDDDAAQELDNLLSAFAEDEDDDRPVENTADVHKEIAVDANHGATQELDQLLSEFSDEEEDDSSKKG